MDVFRLKLIISYIMPVPPVMWYYIKSSEEEGAIAAFHCMRTMNSAYKKIFGVNLIAVWSRR